MNFTVSAYTGGRAVTFTATSDGVSTVVRSGSQATLEAVVVHMGMQGADGIASNYPHAQSIASTGWTVPHNLNRHPSVTTTDPLGNVIHGDVAYVDTNIVQITHGSALTGFAYCN